MFKIAQSDTYEWPVKVKMPVGPNQFENHVFTAIFKRVPQDRIEALSDAKVSDRAYAREVMVGWGKDVLDAEDNAVPFTANTFEQFLNIPTVASAIVVSYAESVSGLLSKN